MSALKKEVRVIEIISLTQGALLVMLALCWKLREKFAGMAAPADAQDLLAFSQNLAIGLMASILIAIAGLGFWKSKSRARVMAALP